MTFDGITYFRKFRSLKANAEVDLILSLWNLKGLFVSKKAVFNGKPTLTKVNRAHINF